MTPQEAIAYFKNCNITMKYGAENYFKAEDVTNLAIKALEKQIPKKQTPDMRCPNCGHSVYNDSYKFCMKCGQAIDWSDAE